MLTVWCMLVMSVIIRRRRLYYIYKNIEREMPYIACAQAYS